ncbi:hypothetical protein ACFFRR_005457 [Megaselia abdita]
MSLTNLLENTNFIVGYSANRISSTVAISLMTQQSRQLFHLLFVITIFSTTLCSIMKKKELNKESSIIERKATEVIGYIPSDQLIEDGNHLFVPAMEIVNRIRSNFFTAEVNQIEGGRTFGKIRRLQMAMIPLLFKFGVISAMVTALLFLTIKVIFLLKALLVLNLGSILAKLITFKSSYHMQPQWPYSEGFITKDSQIWPRTSEPTIMPNKEIHVHIHNSGASNGYVDSSFINEPYGANNVYAPSQNNPVPVSTWKQQYNGYASNHI